MPCPAKQPTCPEELNRTPEGRDWLIDDGLDHGVNTTGRTVQMSSARTSHAAENARTYAVSLMHACFNNISIPNYCLPTPNTMPQMEVEQLYLCLLHLLLCCLHQGFCYCKSKCAEPDRSLHETSFHTPRPTMHYTQCNFQPLPSFISTYNLWNEQAESPNTYVAIKLIMRKLCFAAHCTYR